MTTMRHEHEHAPVGNLTVSTLPKTENRHEREHCTASTGGPAWGIWIDGRDADKGKNAYGSSYSSDMYSAVEGVYEMHASLALGSEDEGLTLNHFLRIRHLVHGKWRDYPNPVGRGIRHCQETSLPHNEFSAIMANITVLDKNYRPVKGTDWNTVHFSSTDSHRIGIRHFSNALENLIHHYNEKLKQCSNASQRLVVLAWFLQNLSFIHPLRDRNGRSRLLLLQFELRRLGIGCGTMMYNNGKNVYFDTLDTFVKKIKEGIKMYDVAISSGQNPWVVGFSSLLENRSQRFNLSYSRLSLCQCWTAHFPGPIYGTPL
jgi:hypothetical protein